MNCSNKCIVVALAVGFLSITVDKARAADEPLVIQPPPASLMTGTIQERTATLTDIMAGKADGRIKEFHSGDMAISLAFHMVGVQSQIDMEVDWAPLKKAGVKSDVTFSADLYEKSFPQFLAILTSICRPTTGYIGCKIEDGLLKIVPTEKPMGVDDAESNAAITAALKQPIKAMKIPEAEIELGKMLHVFSQASKIDIVIDHAALGAAGISQDMKIRPPAAAATAGAYLDALIAAAKQPGKAAVVYTLEHGAIFIAAGDKK